MPVRRTLVAAVAIAGSALAVAAPAHAATLTTLVPCVPYDAGVRNLPIAGTGFTPGGRVTIQSAPKGSTTPTFLTGADVDPAGNFTIAALPPSFNPFSRKLQTFGLLATDGTNPALVAVASYQQVRPGYDFNPSSGRPARKVTHTARGFAPGKTVYLHLRFGGRTIRTVSLGSASAPCGVATKRLALLPTRSRRGTWKYYVDQSKTFSASTRPQARSGLIIRTVYR